MDNIEQIVNESLQKAVLDFFKTMLNLELEVEDISNDPSIIYKDITSMIGLSGEYKGVVNIYFPQNVALEIVSAMLGMDIQEVDSDTKDAIGEVANIVVGGARNFLYDNKINCNISTPTVIVGKDYTVFSGSLKKIIIPFKISAGRFFIEYYLKKN